MWVGEWLHVDEASESTLHGTLNLEDDHDRARRATAMASTKGYRRGDLDGEGGRGRYVN